LKPEHIDSKRMLIKVVGGKGRKDRYTMLSRMLLEELRRYYQACHRKTYLFPSSIKKRKEQPLSYEAVRCIYEKARKKAGVKNGEGFIRCATALPPICWRPDTISAKSRSCWAIQDCPPP
jgi:integrase/recombinase XerD